MSEKQYKEYLSGAFAKLSQDKLCYLFNDWCDTLPNHKIYRAYDLLIADTEKRNDILAIFREWVNTIIAEELGKEWYEREVEL